MTCENNNRNFINNKKKWIVIGSGACGIAVIGKLLDQNIDLNQLLWIDPEFKSGDIGMKWRTVSSNTTVGLFTKFLNNCKSFDYKNCPIDFNLKHLKPEDTCKLAEIADPLQWVTEKLINEKKVPIVRGMVNELIKSNNGDNTEWIVSIKIKSNQEKKEEQEDIIKVLGENIVLTIGSEPSTLPIPDENKQSLITVEQVVNPEELKKVCSKEDTVAVYGSSHTAIIALYNICDIGSKIINFYRSPLKYAVYYDDWILYDNTGLKGYSAQWAKEHLEKNPSSLIERIQVDSNPHQNCDKEFIQKKLSSCNKIVYAIGFDRRNTINIKLNDSDDSWINSSKLKYSESNGIIAPGLFGIGIAFPQFKPDRIGNLEYNVGLWKFMVYLDEVLPIWLNKK